MPSTMLLDGIGWDLVLDANNNIALATEPYALAQDAASAIKTFLGECYWDTTVGVDWLGKILGKTPSVATIKASLTAAALTVPNVVSARVFISSIDQRVVAGQVQVVGATGQFSSASFSSLNPQVA